MTPKIYKVSIENTQGSMTLFGGFYQATRRTRMAFFQQLKIRGGIGLLFFCLFTVVFMASASAAKPTFSFTGSYVQYVCDLDTMSDDLDIYLEVRGGDYDSYHFNMILKNKKNPSDYIERSVTVGRDSYNKVGYMLGWIMKEMLLTPGEYNLEIVLWGPSVFEWYDPPYKSADITIKTEENCNRDLCIFSVGPYYPCGNELYRDCSAESVNMINLWKCYSEAKDYVFNFKLFNRHINPSLCCDDILQMIRNQADSLSGADVFVFSFTGHGVINKLYVDYDDGKECIITANSLYEALKPLADKGLRLYLLIDSCHSGSFKDELERLGSKAQVTIYTSAGVTTKAWRNCTDSGLWISAFNYAFYKIHMAKNNLESCIALIGSMEYNCPVLAKMISKGAFFSHENEFEELDNWEDEVALALADLENFPELIGNYIYNQFGEEGVMSDELWDPDYQKGTLAAITTTTVSASTYQTAFSGGEITADGGFPITARGVCWSTTENPTTINDKTTDGSGTGVFASSITGLTPGTCYYVRAYATNSVGTAYGNEVVFTTAAPSTWYVNMDEPCPMDPCYSSIQSALDVAKDGDTICIEQGTYEESPTRSTAGTVTLSGGWNSTFMDITGTTIIYAPRATSGGGIKLQPNIKVVAPE